MAEQNKKPDYTDMDWRPLILDRHKKWGEMMESLSKEEWKVFDVREEAGFTARVALKPVHEGSKRGTFIVCAGGGFMFKSSNEAKPVAEFFYEQGINVAILDYHVDADTPMGENEEIKLMAGEDGLAAVRFLRAHADELGILEDKIAIGGFSAGGMITAYAATQFDYGKMDALDSMEGVSSRPDAALVLYGAMSNSGIVNGGMFGYTPQTQAKRAKFDAVRNIKSDCPPMFVFQTHADDPRHALIFCMELANYGVPYEIHTFEKGPHGGALYNGIDEDTPNYPHTSKWASLAAEWLIDRGF